MKGMGLCLQCPFIQSRHCKSHKVMGMPTPFYLSSFYFFYFALLGVLAPYLGLYLESRGLNAVEIAQLVALMLGTKIIAPNIWGALADRYQARLGLVRMGSLCTAGGYLLFLWAESFWTFALAIFVFTFFWNAILAQFEVLTLFALGSQRDRYSRIRLWGSIGFIASVGGLGGFLEVFGMHWFPWLTLLIIGAIALSSFAPLQEPFIQNETSTSAIGFWRQCLAPGIWPFFAVCFLLQLSHAAYYTYFSLYLATLGYGEGMIGALWSLGVLAEVLLFIYMHHWFARWSMVSIMLCALGLTALRWILIAGLSESLPLLLLAQTLHALSFGAMHAVSIRYVHQVFAPRFQGRAQALYSAIGFGAGGAVGALACAALYASSGSYQVTFWFSVLVILPCLLCAARLRRHVHD